MKKLLMPVLLSAFVACIGCTSNVDVNANKKPGCCKSKDKVASDVCPCTVPDQYCDKNPSDYSLDHKCPCKATNCICTR
jgi:hypothetical protein